MKASHCLGSSEPTHSATLFSYVSFLLMAAIPKVYKLGLVVTIV